jgi:CDP-diacylglycerol--glycerol-3-phosphate 3-phosphatidyltransferase
VLFAAASATDFLDGYLARQAHAQSRFGRIVDPLADRLLINLALILLVYHQRLEWWLAAPVLLRDALLAAVFRARHEATEVRVNLIGKSATAAIMLALMLLMLVEDGWPKAIYVIGVALSVVAGIRYLKEPQGGLESWPSCWQVARAPAFARSPPTSPSRWCRSSASRAWSTSSSCCGGTGWTTLWSRSPTCRR